MGQITESFAKTMIQNCERGEHAPFTVWEEKQLLITWLAHEKARRESEMLMSFYDVGTLAELISEQARHIERLQAKLTRDTDHGAPRRAREG